MSGCSSVGACVQKFPTDKAYFIAKELLTTERTFIKDLQVVTEVRGRDDLQKIQAEHLDMTKIRFG